jgi:serine O-acetyltransferase
VSPHHGALATTCAFSQHVEVNPTVIEDLRTACRRDAALFGVRVCEALLYQGLWALWAHRLAHRLYRWHVPFIPRLVSQFARALTGIEIHPGATIGRRFFIDHGAGVVIGETTVIGDDVTMYHHVTLGGRGWWRDAKGARRHPIVGDRVVLGVGATVLGPVHISNDARVGPHALVLRDIPAGARVDAPRSVVVQATPAEPASAAVPSVDNEEAINAHVPERSRSDRPYPARRAVPLRR